MADGAGDQPASTSALPAASSDAPSQSTTQPASSVTEQPSQSIAEDAPLESLPDREIDAEINPVASGSAAADDNMNLDGANDAAGAASGDAAGNAATTTALDVEGALNNLPAVLEPRIPQKKDTSLREFLGKMDDYAPLIPDAVTDYYMTVAGLPPPPESDRRLARLLALATQKFIADIAADAYQYSRIRSTNTTSNNPLTGLGGAAGFGTAAAAPAAGDAEGAARGGKKDSGKSAPLGGPRAGYGGGGAGAAQGRTVLTMEDLGMAVGEYGVNVKRGEFYR
ncbi:transcription initiation factor IID, TAF10 subunit [Dissoconium aciculare CBS 342.82]|uniref:Transcription initiation factor TFIID subunit 10 n=1 Tax=Dissoconium aciculare CBS 342.82 TaxID=1314786 RepID=A0A6J3M3T3_9PEZI|nr:transcription initiation factor IID, TAF10 subunit [Dissoconium aciculare CBS 342.82]KAF1821582.1 transcription initiation factor IID, TAF10 subunit [Dissoconium aciculare CBS 342.82]